MRRRSALVWVAAAAMAPVGLSHVSRANAAPSDTPAPASTSVLPERLTSQGYVTWIHPRPSTAAGFIGYVRNGSSITLRSTGLVPGEGCAGGFFEVEPRGFVCNDRTVTRAPSAHRVETTVVASRVAGPLPFRYAFSDGAPMYNRVPTRAEQQRAELGFGPSGSARAPYARAAVYHDLASLAPIAPVDAMPSFLAGGGTTAENRMGLVRDALPVGSILSFTRAFEAEGRTWLFSADQALVPADRVRAFASSSFHGVRLGGDVALPIAWMRATAKTRFRKTGNGVEANRVGPAGAWAVRTFTQLTGSSFDADGQRYLETRDKDTDGAPLFVREKDATVVEAETELPRLAKPGQKWISVSITAGTLVAYEGKTPVYATLISPGRGGLPVAGRDPVQDSTTPMGTYAITFKDRAVTMSPDTSGGPRRHYISDVPHVQYFKAPFALHAAIWHERFGEPASAGCINASPLDAEALFQWTDPPVPEEWQGAVGAGAPMNGKTTLVVVRR